MVMIAVGCDFASSTNMVMIAVGCDSASSTNMVMIAVGCDSASSTCLHTNKPVYTNICKVTKMSG